MKEYEAKGRTTEEAISAGLMHLGVAISDVSVEILEEGSKGLFGLFGSRSAKVRLTIKEEDGNENDTIAIFANSLDMPDARKNEDQRPAKTPLSIRPIEKKSEPKQKKNPRQTVIAEQPASKQNITLKLVLSAQTARSDAFRQTQNSKEIVQVRSSAKPILSAVPVDRNTPAGQTQEFLQQLTKRMGVNVTIAVATDEEGNIHVNMEGDTLGILIGRRGETLDALQYLTSLQVNKGRQDYIRVTLDTEDYRAKREEALIRLANRMANRAQKTGRKVALEPMNPYERRILHSALQTNLAVSTHSEGEEPNRHVVITLNTEGGKEDRKQVE